MAHFTVIGLYEGSLQRFAQTFEAWDQEAAQVLAMHEFPRLLVAGVVEGEVATVDHATHGYEAG